MQDHFFPFYRLGLQRNPFGSLTREEWVEIAILHPAVEELLERGFDHLQIIGEKGRGKSTLCLKLLNHFREQGEKTAYERIPQWRFLFHTPLKGLNRFALDEAQRCIWWERGRLFRAAKKGLRLILGTHVDYARRFRWHGLSLETVYAADLSSVEHVKKLLQRRLEYFARKENSSLKMRFSDEAVAWLWQHFQDNLRGMEFFLYEVFQGFPAFLDSDIITPESLEKFAVRPPEFQREF